MKLRFLVAAALVAISAACSSPVAPVVNAPAAAHRDGTTPPDSTTTRSADSTYGMGSGN
ncbi:MAG TPA: hypothetical protein VFH27_05515 [Longimicrobiaceae bacterium]|nr:hypothetical protein [Longimicrobiaceae bacterium]